MCSFRGPKGKHVRRMKEWCLESRRPNFQANCTSGWDLPWKSLCKWNKPDSERQKWYCFLLYAHGTLCLCIYMWHWGKKGPMEGTRFKEREEERQRLCVMKESKATWEDERDYPDHKHLKSQCSLLKTVMDLHPGWRSDYSLSGDDWSRGHSWVLPGFSPLEIWRQ